MNKEKTISKPIILSFLVAAFFFSCKPIIALYDQHAYTQATAIKVDLQNLIDKSVSTDFSAAKADIEAVTTAIQKAMEYSRGREKDFLTTKQYDILLAEDRSYKQFLKTWESKGKTSATFAGEFKKTSGEIMDQIIKLENGKNKPE